GDGGIKTVAVVSIVGLTVLNSLGVRLGAVTQNVLTLTKMGLLAVLIVVGFVLPGGNVANLAPLWSDAPPGRQIASFGVALVAVLWAYDGWIEVTYVGGEVKDPERDVPRSIVLSTLIGAALYCLVTTSFAYVWSPARMAGSSLVASDAAQVTLGHAGAGLVAAAIMIAAATSPAPACPSVTCAASDATSDEPAIRAGDHTYAKDVVTRQYSAAPIRVDSTMERGTSRSGSF